MGARRARSLCKTLAVPEDLSGSDDFGATGLTFFDDEVTDFFSPHAAGKSVMFLIALGHATRALLQVRA